MSFDLSLNKHELENDFDLYTIIKLNDAYLLASFVIRQ